MFCTDESHINVNYRPRKLLHNKGIKSALEAKEKGLSLGVHRPAGKGRRICMVAIVGSLNYSYLHLNISNLIELLLGRQ